MCIAVLKSPAAAKEVDSNQIVGILRLCARHVELLLGSCVPTYFSSSAFHSSSLLVRGGRYAFVHCVVMRCG